MSKSKFRYYFIDEDGDCPGGTSDEGLKDYISKNFVGYFIDTEDEEVKELQQDEFNLE